MKKELDIHNYAVKVKSGLKRLEESEISAVNKKRIIEFTDYCTVSGIGLPRIERYLGILAYWARLLGKDFDKVTKEDMMKAVKKLQDTEKYAPWTKSTYKSMIKRFYKCLKITQKKRRNQKN